MPDEEFYALALDKEKNQVKVISSNPGHLLFTEIVLEERIDKVIKRLFRKDIFTEFGLRTISSKEIFYTYNSYHCGSIWPHDNWIFFKGLLKLKRYKEAFGVAKSCLNAFSELGCIPELYCVNEKLKVYPDSCIIQAWAVGAALSFIDFVRFYNQRAK